MKRTFLVPTLMGVAICLSAAGCGPANEEDPADPFMAGVYAVTDLTSTQDNCSLLGGSSSPTADIVVRRPSSKQLELVNIATGSVQSGIASLHNNGFRNTPSCSFIEEKSVTVTPSGEKRLRAVFDVRHSMRSGDCSPASFTSCRSLWTLELQRKGREASPPAQ